MEQLAARKGNSRCPSHCSRPLEYISRSKYEQINKQEERGREKDEQGQIQFSRVAKREREFNFRVAVDPKDQSWSE